MSSTPPHESAKQSSFRQEAIKAMPALIPIFIDVVGVSVILPLVAVHMDALGEPVEAVGTILTANFLGQMLGTPLLGGLADRFGPKKALLVSMFGNTIFFTLSAFMTSVPALATVRFFGAMCNAIGGGQKWIIDSTTVEFRERVMSLLVLDFLLGFLAGAGIGAATGSWLICCLVTAGGSALAGVVLLFLTEPRTKEDRLAAREANAGAKARGEEVKSMRDGFKSPGWWLSTAVALACGILFGTTSTLNSVVLLVQFELTGAEGAFYSGVSYYIAIGAVVLTQATVGSLISKNLPLELGMTIGVAVGGIMLAVCGVLFDLESFWPFIMCAMPATFASVVLSLVPADVALSAAIEVISPDLTGGMMGIQKLFHFSAVAFMPVISVQAYVRAPRVAFFAIGASVTALALGAMIAAAIYRKELEEARMMPDKESPFTVPQAATKSVAVVKPSSSSAGDSNGAAPRGSAGTGSNDIANV
eukprot:CAMPEP_0206041050 /NCGR_PEP_ID=MMETSP1466-20131121/5736_1 /ASSEMBLY_ACC=CAM_ASM_001126 /TAXON_ID=44452 /ORGANISM="Pavlova gyrans, Strain CCMP608" /LENGTH=474 /DNA_ID=CAMNT_0053415737 /DNA_START=45 /DNA_END=1469 /DNA_ORIENTATION=-